MIGQVRRSPENQQQQEHQTLLMEQTNELGGVDNFLFSRDPTKASFISASTLATQEEMMGMRISNDDESDDMSSHCSYNPACGNEQQSTPTEQQQFFDVVEAESPVGRMRIASTLLGNNQAGISYLAQYLSATPAQQQDVSFPQQPVLTMAESNPRKRPHDEPTIAQLLQSHKQRHQSPHPGDGIQLEEDRLLASLLGTGAPC